MRNPPDRPFPATTAGLSRGRFLGLGAAGAGALLLAACGDDETIGAAGGTGGPELALRQFIGPRALAAGTAVRVPFAVIDIEGHVPPAELPERLEVTVFGPDETEVGRPVSVDRHDDGIPRSYYPLVFAAADPGPYTARAEIRGTGAEMSIQVHADDELTLIRPGMQLPAIQTPTPGDDRGVTPICTRDPACPLHDVTLAEALDEDRPVVLLVATPAFCQMAVCGPVLDVLLDEMDAAPGARFLHAEVYEDPFDNVQSTTETVRRLELAFEPVLVVADAGGTVVERLDVIYDRRELRDVLGRTVGAA